MPNNHRPKKLYETDSVFSLDLDLIILLETACSKEDKLWTCNDFYSAYYLPSATLDRHHALWSGVAILAKDLIKIQLL